MPVVEERIESRSGSIDTQGYTFFPYALITGSGGSGSSGAEEQPTGGVLVNLTPIELLAIQAAQGGVIAASSGSSGGSGGSGGGGCPTTGAGFLFTQTGDYVRKFHVYTSACESLLDAKSARDAVGIPLLGDPFPTDPYSIAVRKSSDSEPDDPGMWYVTVEYSREGNPLLEPWEIEWDFNTFTIAVTEDIHGVKIRNSAKRPFDPPVEIERHRFTLTLTRNVHFWSLGNAIIFSNSINNADVAMAGQVFSARKLKCNCWKAVAFNHLGRRFWRETLVIEFNNDTWLAKIGDVGYADINGHPFNQSGWANNSPVPLNPNGTFRNPGDDILYLERNSLPGVQVYPENDFCELNLDYGA